MVEVFKTDVTNAEDAIKLVKEIEQYLPEYCANFDLDDCDRILRISTANGVVMASPIIAILGQLGFKAVILPDDFSRITGLLRFG